jgi:signal transduction histidine kinase
VADNGIGIPPAALPHIFDRFFRVDKARSRELGGAGLGLSIVKSICAAHAGRVAVQSKEGEGSRFTVELPLAAENLPG